MFKAAPRSRRLPASKPHRERGGVGLEMGGGVLCFSLCLKAWDGEDGEKSRARRPLGVTAPSGCQEREEDAPWGFGMYQLCFRLPLPHVLPEPEKFGFPKGFLGMRLLPLSQPRIALTPPRPPKQTNKPNSRHQIVPHKSSASRCAPEKALFLLH